MSTPPENRQQVSLPGDIPISEWARQPAFAVMWTDWDFAKERIAKCQVKFDFWGMLISLGLGLGFALVGVAVTLKWATIPTSLMAASFMAAIMAGIGRFTLGRQNQQSINTVLEYMKQIEKRYQRPSESPESQ